MQFKYVMLCIMLMVSFAMSSYAQPPNKKAGDEPAQETEAQETEAQETEAEPVDEGSTIEKGSFLIGFNTISRLKQQGAPYDFEKVMEGLKAANEGSEPGMSREEQRSVLMAYQQILRQRIRDKRKAEAEKNRVEGETALAEFAKQEGAKELEDGVMYVVLKEGAGEIPEAPDRVRVNYIGTYTNGEEFDSSIDKGKALEMGVLQFVPGFSKALQSMKVGSKWKVIIRGDKAYGMSPRPPMELNKTLVFEVDLLEILEPK